MFSNSTLKLIFNRTSGHCHFCGDPLVFAKYGSNRQGDLIGAWEVDHVVQKGKGGSRTADNCLATCIQCNRLRWHRKSHDLRELIFLGLIVKDEMKKGSNKRRRSSQA